VAFSGGETTLEFTGPGYSVSNPLAFQSGTGTIMVNGGLMALSGQLSGTGAWTKAGAATLSVVGTDNATGPITVGQGVLQFPSASIVSASAAGITVLDFATLDALPCVRRDA
jgi:hypothetical protein